MSQHYDGPVAGAFSSFNHPQAVTRVPRSDR